MLQEKDVYFTTDKDVYFTVNSTVESLQYLLKAGMPYVLTERCTQDDCEEYFSCQRAIGRRSENPNMQKFGYNSNNILFGIPLSQVAGNTRGKYHGLKKKTAWYETDNLPLKKRKTGNTCKK